MFSPQRRAPTPARLADNGKTVAYIDGPPPPLGSLSGGGREVKASPESQSADWRRFKEAGLLDAAAMERRDRQELAYKVAKLEAELYDYQHNMGLLLMEKKEWAFQHEELSQALAETNEILQKEQRAHLIAMSEVESREENLRRILVEEKKAVAELAEANKKSVEVERRLREVETRESVLRREQASLATEKEVHKETFYRQREDLNEWVKKLKEGDARLSNLRKLLNEKEEKTNENEMILKKNR